MKNVTCIQDIIFSVVISMDVGSSTPRAKRINGIQSWMLGCIVMVIAALAEYGIILLIKFLDENNLKIWENCKNIEKTKSKDANEDVYRKQQNKNDVTVDSGDTLAHHRLWFMREKNANVASLEDKASTPNFRKIDSISLIVFPIAFFVFIMAYWFSF